MTTHSGTLIERLGLARSAMTDAAGSESYRLSRLGLVPADGAPRTGSYSAECRTRHSRGTFRLSRRLLERLRTYAADGNLYQYVVVEEAIDDYLERLVLPAGKVQCSGGQTPPQSADRFGRLVETARTTLRALACRMDNTLLPLLRRFGSLAQLAAQATRCALTRWIDSTLVPLLRRLWSSARAAVQAVGRYCRRLIGSE